MSSSTWALAQISQLLPLDEDSLQQILAYSATLPNDAAAEHLTNLLGDSPMALEFISAFNARRTAPPSSDPDPVRSTSAPPRKSRKKKAPIGKLPPPRQPENHGNTSGAYAKKEEEDYMSASHRARPSAPVASAVALSDAPAARQLPTATSAHAKPPPSASGPLISDLPNVRTSARTASPAAKAKINVSGGAPMRGASTTLQDLVIRLPPPPSIPRRLTFVGRIPQFEPWSFKPTLPSRPLRRPAAVHASPPATPSSPQPPTVSTAGKSSA